jgi:hypothetical protein
MSLTKNEYANAKRLVKEHVDSMKHGVISTLTKNEKKELKLYQEKLMMQFFEEGRTKDDDDRIWNKQLQQLTEMAQTIDTLENPIVRYAYLTQMYSEMFDIESPRTIAIVRNLRFNK